MTLISALVIVLSKAVFAEIAVSFVSEHLGLYSGFISQESSTIEGSVLHNSTAILCCGSLSFQRSELHTGVFFSNRNKTKESRPLHAVLCVYTAMAV